MENTEGKSNGVQHQNGYVLTKAGSKDFGEITPEIAAEIHHESGKIRLEIGYHNSDGRGFGETHIERDERLKQLNQNGFDNARDFIEYVADNFDAIYEGRNNTLIIVKKDEKANIAYLSLKQNEVDKDVFYTVESSLISRQNYLKENKLLWINPNSSYKKEQERAQSYHLNETPSAISGNSFDNINLSQKDNSVNQNIQGEQSMEFTNENQEKTLSATDYLIEKINNSGIEVHLSKEEMKAILDAGKDVQKMAVKFGTNQEIGDNSFNGYGTYVVSLNEENARQFGIKIAARKYGGTFYINNRPLSDFLEEKNFSSFWTKRLEEFKSHSIDELTDEILRADVKGNSSLKKEQTALTTLLSLDLVEYKREQTFLYSVDIPDNDNTNYLFYNNPIGIDNAKKINDQLAKLGVEWNVSRNDDGKTVYYELLSKNVFSGNQKHASEFLKTIGYVGMQMDDSNYIIFNDRDMSITDRVQYMKDHDGEVYGFAFEGNIYVDEDLVNSNVLAHEYTHIWDEYTRNNNPELWQQGKDILKGTSIWQEIVEDKNYENLKTDDEILSEVHARITGQFAQQVLERIEKQDGELTKDRAIDWDKEVNEFVTEELLIKPELGSKNYIPDTVKVEYLKKFLSMPMKDLMNEVRINISDFSLEENKSKHPKMVLSESNENKIYASDILKEIWDLKLGENMYDNYQMTGRSAVVQEGLINILVDMAAYETSDFLDYSFPSSKLQIEDKDAIENLKQILKQYDPKNIVMDFDNIDVDGIDYDNWYKKCGAIPDTEMMKIIISGAENNYNYIINYESVSEQEQNNIGKNGEVIEADVASQEEKSVENHQLEEHILKDSFGVDFTAPNYWSDDDISKWNEMTGREVSDAEIISTLGFVVEAAKVINGQEPLEYINNIEYLILPEKIESVEELVNKEKEHRNSAYELFQKEYKNQQNVQETEDKIIEQEQTNVDMNKNVETYESTTNLYIPKNKWSEDLKEVITNVSYQEMINNRELQIEGKAGNEEAAVQLVDKLVNDNIISQLVEKYPNAIVAPVPSMETADKKPNAIPLAYARKFEKAGLKIAEDIIEIDSAHHTGKKAFKRVVNRPHFDGTIENGKEYIIVDDVYAMGGTINSMKNFIEDKGGIVVAVSTLTPSVENSKILAITDENLNSLKSLDQKGDLLNAIRKLDIAENFEALTDPIGKYIVNNREKIINEERTRRAQNNSKTNAEENQRIDQIKAESVDYNSPIESLDKIVDNGIELVQSNYGMSEAAMEADIAAQEEYVAGEPEYQEEPEVMFYDSNNNPYYPQTVLSVLENFSNVDIANWNLPLEDKTDVYHLIDIAELKKNDYENSVTKLREYLQSEEFKREEENYARIFTPILITNQGQDFDPVTHTFSSEKFSFPFSTDDIKQEVEEQSVETPEPVQEEKPEKPVVKGVIESVSGNPFTGNNEKLVQVFQDELISRGIVKPEEKLVLLTEIEANARGSKVKENQPYVLLNIPVQNGEKTEFVSTKYYHISSLENQQQIEAENKSGNGIVFGKTKVPEVSLITQTGLQLFKDMVVDSYDQNSKMYFLKSQDGEKSLHLTENTLNVLMTDEYNRQAKTYTEDTKIKEKMIQAQYNDFFETRSNCANNFRHNLAVFCRKEANSPLDALQIASSLIKQMPKEEQHKTKELLNLLKKEDQTINEVLIETYHDAVKDSPLNEEYLKRGRYENIIARPMYDTISKEVEKIDKDFSLKIGDSVEVQFKVSKSIIGKSANKENLTFANCKIISASKENNMVTLMDGNKSFYDVPRDTFLKEYARTEKLDRKQEKGNSHKHSMKIEITR